MRRPCSPRGRRTASIARRRSRHAAKTAGGESCGAGRVEAGGEAGGWRFVRREFGYPAGMARRMSLPLGRLPKGARELRLRTTQEIYWDRLAVAYASRSPIAPGRVLPLTSARLA